jgi:hypothetical protein
MRHYEGVLETINVYIFIWITIFDKCYQKKIGRLYYHLK